MAPLFSIVIPTFNRSDLFPYAVRSILNQSISDYEIVLSDNCSGDDTRSVAQQFRQSSFKYCCTPRHYTIADNWEFARKQASGRMIIMLSDDDALVPSALERFACQVKDPDRDFLFSSIAEYRDVTYPGSDRNTANCPTCSGSIRQISAEDLIRPLFSFRVSYGMHPSAFVFPGKIADYVETRTGRFFWTNGVEYSAWPITASFAERIVHIDLPLTLLGRTGKSWGSNIALCNPGKEKIQAMVSDVDPVRRHAPLNNYTMTNLIADGILTAKELFPKEFAQYEFDEYRYLHQTIRELMKRQALGVDVSKEISEALSYSARNREWLDNLNKLMREPLKQQNNGIKSTFTKIVSKVKREMHGINGGGAIIAGNIHGFNDILQASLYLERNMCYQNTKAK